MARTHRNGWVTLTGSDTGHRGIRHHATNDWFSKKNACCGSSGNAWDEYWGRDKRGVKQITRRRDRRKNNRIIG